MALGALKLNYNNWSFFNKFKRTTSYEKKRKKFVIFIFLDQEIVAIKYDRSMAVLNIEHGSRLRNHNNLSLGSM